MNVDAILQIARSMNVGLILANQSMLDLKREDLIPVVEANCRYRQWYAISSPEEQERLSNGSGETVDLCTRPLCPLNAMDSRRGQPAGGGELSRVRPPMSLTSAMRPFDFTCFTHAFTDV